MSSRELYVKDARIWLPHADKVWEGAVLQKNYIEGDVVLAVTTDEGDERQIQIKTKDDLPPLRNPAILIGQNDLTALSYLHEPGVLYNLKVRFCDRQSIYTYCGIVLVAINPYAELPLYGPDIIRAYRGHSMGELEPHIFAVAEEAYARLEREKCDLSIIVSGESGAGKTVSAKYAMRYFAAVGGNEMETHIERKVLASSPIMEAIGNAKTTRNDNSSRFGKFTKLLFTNDSASMLLTGATMQTYLLEKSRVVFQATGERNYHIFYQLCAARDQWPELMLEHYDKFHYLNQGQSAEIPRVSDLDSFSETIAALHTLGFTAEEVSDLVKILSGILHLGNVRFTHKYKRGTEEIDNEGCDVSIGDTSLNLMCEILQINPSEMQKWLVTRQIESINDMVLIPQNRDSAEAARDALAKHIYAKLFQHIVDVINRSLHGGMEEGCFIGVLDIYGFETFEINSFEQFCINYANEKLQQQFNQHVFKLEQQEYVKEGIEWTMIDFYDNQPCIDLIETKLGILDLLDEECRMPRGSDDSWAGKLFEKCSKFVHFEKPRFGMTSFLIKHFSDTVEYDVYGFLEKNRDTVSKELVNVLKASDMILVRKLMEIDDESRGSRSNTSLGGRVILSASKTQQSLVGPKRITPGKQHKQTVGSQFRDSLTMLITTLHSTTPHYVRCIKPNDDKAAFQWEAPKIVQQLRACGVLETIRISAAGFPSRWNYADFYARYRLLCTISESSDGDVRMICTKIITKWLQDDTYKFGKTQIFFRAGQVAYLEQMRSDIRRRYIVLVQSVVRRFVSRKKFLKLRMIVLGLQRYGRGYLARQKAEQIRRTRAAVTIQRNVRGFIMRRRYNRIIYGIRGIQRHGRGFLARKTFSVALDNHKATQIQRLCRGYLARQAAKDKLNKIIKCQAVVRGFLARKLYKRMKAEARTISHMQKMYKGLENKIISLQQKIDELNKENNMLKTKSAEIPELRLKLETIKTLELELKNLRLNLNEKDQLIDDLKKKLETECDEKMLLLEDKDKLEQDRDQRELTWRIENDELKKQLDSLIDSAKMNSLSEKKSLDGSQDAYQKAVKNIETIEKENFILKAEVEEKEFLEKENKLLKEEINRLMRMAITGKGVPNEYLTMQRSLATNSFNNSDDDFGYDSAKNTLELSSIAKSSTPSKSSNGDITNSTEMAQILSSDAVSRGLNLNDVSERFSQTSLVLKLRKIVDDEKFKGSFLENKLERMKNQISNLGSSEDAIRISELEMENEKIRKEYMLLRQSISRGVEFQELNAQYKNLEEELVRRRDESIQLKSVLAKQTESIRSLESLSLKGSLNDMNQLKEELIEAFQAQKLVNRQLECELRAQTDENNARLAELNTYIDKLREDKEKLEEICRSSVELVETDNKSLNDLEVLKRSELYLRYELDKTTSAYVDLQERVNKQLQELENKNKNITVLTQQLRRHGLSDAFGGNDLDYDDSNLVIPKMKSQNYQGIFKYQHSDEAKILRRIITDLKPRVAITLLPGLPAYILFMCIRYTDLVNIDQPVRTLLTNFTIAVRKLNTTAITVDYRVLWLVNTLTLHNLLNQYGGNEEYMKFNSDIQNQQQLKNFDLVEYKQIIYELILYLYNLMVRYVQELIKGYIVPAILDHDEMARGRGVRSTSTDSESSVRPSGGPQSLVNVLDQYYKQFQYFGLPNCYLEQIFRQLMNYICAISLNNLMLRQDLCVWKTGMKIRYNVRCVEEWVRKTKMSIDVLTPLQPLNQVSALLQSRKSEDDVENIYELCSSLTTGQVLKIIKSYTLDDCELPIKPIFVDKLAKKLNERENMPTNDTFIMEENQIQPLKVAYIYSEIRLEEIQLPEILNLNDLLTKI